MCKDHQNFVEKKGHCNKVAAVCADVIYVNLKSTHTQRRCCAAYVAHVYDVPLACCFFLVAYAASLSVRLR